MKLRPLGDTILVHNMEKGERTLKSGIVLLNDDGKEHGIRSRWAEVYAVGPQEKHIAPGQWVLIQHGRWSRAIEVNADLTVFKIDNNAVLAVSDEEMSNETVRESTSHGFAKVR